MTRPSPPPSSAPPAHDSKRQSLRRHASLNPRPLAVTDPLFSATGFFDPNDLVQVKYEMLRRVDHDGHSITEAAAQFGFSRPSFYQAQAVFQSGGLPALVPQKRGPKRAHKLTTEVLQFLRQQRDQEPSLSVPALAARLQHRYGVTLHRRTIERALAAPQKKTARQKS